MHTLTRVVGAGASHVCLQDESSPTIVYSCSCYRLYAERVAFTFDAESVKPLDEAMADTDANLVVLADSVCYRCSLDLTGASFGFSALWEPTHRSSSSSLLLFALL